MNSVNSLPGQAGRLAVVQAGRRLQYATMAWNAAECVVALTAGVFAASVALIGFGFDSAIEVTSSVAELWRLWRDPDEVRREASERMRPIAASHAVIALLARVPEPPRDDAIPELLQLSDQLVHAVVGQGHRRVSDVLKSLVELSLQRLVHKGLLARGRVVAESVARRVLVDSPHETAVDTATAIYYRNRA